MPSPARSLEALPGDLHPTLETLSRWAGGASAENDLEKTFGAGLDWPSAYQLLHSLASRDFSVLPPTTFLPPADMPGLWGGYSRSLRRIFLSADCPQRLLAAVFLEEVGHFLDHALCKSETPGDEGAPFAAAVLGTGSTESERSAWLAEESLHPVNHGGRIVLVEAAPKNRGSGTPKSRIIGGNSTNPSTPGTKESQDGTIVYAIKDSVRITQTRPGQRLIGSQGNDTFAVTSQDVRLEDPKGGTDTVETTTSFSLREFSFIENLAASKGAAPLTLTGNNKANAITGNDGHNRLDGGADGARDTLIGGRGNDTYVIRDTLDQVVEAANSGTDTIETTIGNYTLNFANVENVAYAGTGSATLTGNSLANVLTGGTLGDNLVGGGGSSAADTLRGGQGDDLYLVSRQTDRIEEGSGPLDGTDTIRTTASTYSIENFANVEILTYAGSAASRLTGNSGENTINGGRLVRNTIDGGLGNDYLIGGSTTDSLIGGGGNDTLLANAWFDTPLGALGQSLQAGGGTDTLNGGAGNDWYVVNSQTAYTFIETGTDKDTIASTVSYTLKYNKNISDNIENLYLIGKGNLSGTGSDGHNEITGNDGNNSISAGAGNDTVYGGLGGDLVNGEAGNDRIFGGGQPQTDLPATAATAITIKAGESYTGKIDFRRDTDWIRAELNEGVTYTFKLAFTPQGNPGLIQFSDAAFGQAGRDIVPSAISANWWALFSSNRNKSFHPFIGDLAADLDSLLYSAGSQIDESNHRSDHTRLVLGTDGAPADGVIEYDPNSETDTNQNDNIVRFSFTPFATGEFYIPISGAGPLGGSYTVTLTDPDSAGATANPIFADDARNTLIGGLGKDYLVAGNGRDSFGNPIGDILLGGTNGIPGGIDLDSVSGGNLDTLLGGDGGDLLDGGRGNDSMVGGNGNDTYFVDSAGDIASETDDGGQDDLAIFSHGVLRVGGAVYDIDLGERFGNIEHASLTGSANLNVLGNGDGNSLHGNFGNNLLDGANGDDTLLGQGGNDYLIGGDGGDHLDGGSGQNTMDGGLGSDTYTVNDRYDRITNEASGFDGGEDLVRTYLNFDPIQGSALEQFQPDQPDNSPSVTKSPSFASRDLDSFYNLEHFELLGQAAYGVGNALGNSMSAADGTAALLLGMGGDDYLLGGTADDSLHGDTPHFYASPDLYAPAPTDTRTQQFIDGIGLTLHGNDQLFGGDGNDYLDGGRGFDTMVGGAGTNVFIQDHVDDYIVATGGTVRAATLASGLEVKIGNELITSVNISRAPEGINDIMLVVKDQDRDENRLSITGQEQVASFASFLGSKGGNQGAYGYEIGNMDVSISEANRLEVMYSHNVGDTYRSDPTEAYHLALNVGTQRTDEKDNTKVAHELSWSAGPFDELGVIGYTVKYRKTKDEFGNPFVDSDGNPGIWKTYLDGTAQDLRGTQTFPSLLVDNLDPGEYEFEVISNRLAMPVERDFSNPASADFGKALREQVVTLQGGGGNDFLTAQKLVYDLPGGLVDDAYTDPLLFNNPLDPLPLGFLFAPEPVVPNTARQTAFAAHLDGGAGNDLLVSARANGGLGVDYEFQGVEFSGLNTMVGGLGSDTFVVKNGGQAFGDGFDLVIKYGNETPVDYGAGGVGASLNGGQHNLVVSAVPYLTLSDTVVSQGKFIDQLALATSGQFGMGNRLDNFIYDRSASTFNTLVGNTGRDSIVGSGINNVLIGGTAYGLDDVGLAIKDFAPVADGGNGLTNSIFRDTDPIPVGLNGPGAADPSQFWFVPGFYGGVFDPARNRDTLVANDLSILDGGAGHDSLVGSSGGGKKGDNFYVSAGYGGMFSQNIFYGDAVFGNGGNDTVTFTDSDYLWWSGHEEGAILTNNGYTIAGDISNLVLQMGAPTARVGTGNKNSTGNDHDGWFEEIGSNLVVGNELDNILDGGAVGGDGNVGGFDTLTGGLGSDLFVISGYRGATNNKWEPSITDYTEGVRSINGVDVPLAGKSEWDINKSEYTDADFVLVTDFTPGQDFLALSGAATDYWIGAAPTGFSTKNVSPLTGTDTPAANSFGIYRSANYGSGAPDLVAHIRTTGGIELDVASLVLVTDPDTPAAPGALISTGDKSKLILGWGTFYEFDGALFDDGSAVDASLITQSVFQSTIQSPSTASLSALMGQIV